MNTSTAGSVVLLQNMAGESSTDSPASSQVMNYYELRVIVQCCVNTNIEVHRSRDFLGATWLSG